MSEDAVADLIAAPGAAVAEAATSPAAPDAAPIDTAPDRIAAEPAPQPQKEPPSQPEPQPQEVLQPEPAAPTPTEPAVESEPMPSEPAISAPQVSFEPAADLPGAGASEEDGSPPPAAAATEAPPPPPPDPLIDSEDIAAARADAEAPPAPPATAHTEPVAQVIEPQDDPFAGATEDADTFEVGEEVVVAGVEDSSEPAVTIPHREEEPQIRGAVPRPIGDETPPPSAVPRPIGIDREEDQASAARSEPTRRVAVPDREPDVSQDEDEELPPLDGRFRNPGLLGQGVQLLLIASAAIAVAMMLALIVLNNRLDTYATSGESLSRVQSAESIVNTWMRPLLIVVIVISYALLAMWSRRVLENLHAFNNGMEETPLWMWMMPMVNMWVLFRHLDLAWKGSDYYARGARTWQRSIPDVWTVLFVLLPTLGFVLVLYAWVNGADSFSMAIDSNAFSIVGYFAIALGLLAGVRSIANIIERQRTRAEGIR